MNQIILKIPRRKQKIKIVRNEEIIRREFDKKVKELESKYLRELEEIEAEKNAAQAIAEPEPEPEPEVVEIEEPQPIIAKTIFSEFFSISDSNEPIEIDIRNVPEESVSISYAAAEIQNAYLNGFRDGQDSARATHETEIQTQREWIKRFDSIAFALKKEFVKEQRKFQDNLVDLSIMIAQKIIEENIELSESVVLKQIEKAFDEINDDEVYRIIVSESDYKVLSTIKSNLIDSDNEKTILSKSATVDKGGCILETSAGIIDARISTQIKKITEALEQASSREKSKRARTISEDYPVVLDAILPKTNDEIIEDTSDHIEDNELDDNV